jgi:hypothetical protein
MSSKGLWQPKNDKPASKTNQGPRRIGQWLYLRPEKIDEYKKCHAAVWPAVLEQIKDSNVRDCKCGASSGDVT